MWWVYAIQSLKGRPGGKAGFYYVGCTTDPSRRLRQHNGDLVGGSKWTAKHRPHVPRALYGPYKNRSCAQRAEYALKKGKRGKGRAKWSTSDSLWCRGLGAEHPWVTDGVWDPPDEKTHVYPAEPHPPKPRPFTRRKRRRRRRKRSTKR